MWCPNIIQIPSHILLIEYGFGEGLSHGRPHIEPSRLSRVIQNKGVHVLLAPGFFLLRGGRPNKTSFGVGLSSFPPSPHSSPHFPPSRRQALSLQKGVHRQGQDHDSRRDPLPSRLSCRGMAGWISASQLVAVRTWKWTSSLLLEVENLGEHLSPAKGE